MPNRYTPRRCSSRWLDGDCPREVLAIIDDPREVDRYTILYWFGHENETFDGRQWWITFLSLDIHAAWYHGELTTSQAADYRYRAKRHYARWSTLPENIRRAVMRDIQQTREEIREARAKQVAR